MAELTDRFPLIDDLERRARRRLPHFAWEYLASGTGDEAAVHRNRTALEAVTLAPELLKGVLEPDTSTELLGRTYASPIGIAPVGLSGLIWPGADLALAEAAAAKRIPHTLSTVATASLEDVAAVSGDFGWFQLYPPREDELREDLLERVATAGYSALVVTADVPFPSRRERQKKARIRVPPVIGPTLVAQSILHPAWSLAILRHGMPKFGTLEKYLDRNTLRETAGFVGARLGGTLSWDYLTEVRKRWDGPLVVKGIMTAADARRCVDAGADAVQISNHGGRQLEASPSPIEVLPGIVDELAGAVPVLFDSGVRSGADVARALSLGADFVFCGRAFMFGLGALGAPGAGHVFDVLHDGLVNVMHQTGCATVEELRLRVTAG